MGPSALHLGTTALARLLTQNIPSSFNCPLVNLLLIQKYQTITGVSLQLYSTLQYHYSITLQYHYSSVLMPTYINTFSLDQLLFYADILIYLLFCCSIFTEQGKTTVFLKAVNKYSWDFKNAKTILKSCQYLQVNG